jgi:hypothetical protein
VRRLLRDGTACGRSSEDTTVVHFAWHQLIEAYIERSGSIAAGDVTVVMPILLARGVRPWEGLEKDYQVEATSAPSGVTHRGDHTTTFLASLDLRS